MESLKETVANLEQQNKSLQDSIVKEREARRASRTSITLTEQQMQQLSQTSPQLSQPSQTSPLLSQPPQTSSRLSQPPQTSSRLSQPPQTSSRLSQLPTEGAENEELQIDQKTSQKLLVSLEDLLQQTEQEANEETLHWLTNDLGALQLELTGAKNEISAITKQLENKDTRIAQLEEELKKKNEVEASLRKNIETIVQENTRKDADLTSKIFYLEEAARIARQREAVRVVRPVEVKPTPILGNINTSSASAFLSSLFEPTNDIPPANSLTHCFKQGFITKQGSMIKTWKKRFAILQGNMLYYYTPDAKREPRGKLELDSLCVVQEADDFTQKPLSLAIFHPLKQPFFCAAETQQDRAEWIEAFKAACTVVPMKDMD